MSKQDKTEIRWVQRLDNFKTAMKQLESAVHLSQKRSLSDLEKQGVIQSFEFCHELAWNVLKDYFEYQGNPSITGSRDASREAFNKGLIASGEVWMEMIKSRNQTSHTYNKKIADDIVAKALGDYFQSFEELIKQMESLIPK
jgi:nucleotidyltransferase substrate binding protein (TIGR01987 family)